MAYTKQEIAIYEKIRLQALASQIASLFIIGALLIALKLCGALNLTWWWTTAPFWFSGINVLATFMHIGGLRGANTREGQR